MHHTSQAYADESDYCAVEFYRVAVMAVPVVQARSSASISATRERVVYFGGSGTIYMPRCDDAVHNMSICRMRLLSYQDALPV